VADRFVLSVCRASPGESRAGAVDDDVVIGVGPDADDGGPAGKAGLPAQRRRGAGGPDGAGEPVGHGDGTVSANTRESLFFVLGFIGITGPAIGSGDGPPHTWWGWLFLVVGAAAGAVVATSLRHVIADWFRRPGALPKVQLLMSRVVASVLALALTSGITVGLYRGVSYGRTLLRACEAPVEVPVVTDADDLVTANRLAAEFEKTTIQDARGCPTANLTVYDAAPAEVRGALLAGWTSGRSGSSLAGPLDSVGPRPLVWLPPSTVEVDRVVTEAPAADGIVPFARPAVYARTPLVLAASPAVETPAAASQQVQLASLLKERVPVVRPDPGVSSAGELAVAASLGPPPGRRADQLAAWRAFEQQLTAALPETGYPLGSASAVVRAYRELSCRDPKPVAFLLPRQLVEHPEAAGAAADDDCPAGNRDLTLVSTDPTLTMAHPVVLLDWPDAAHDAAPAVARRFRDWLLSEAGRRAIVDAGLQVPVAGGEQPGETGWPVPMNPALLERVDAALEFQASIRRHARIVFALDSSLSMAPSLPAAQSVIDGLVARLGEQDEIGLVTFGRKPVRPVPPGAAGSAAETGTVRDQVRAGALAATPAGETPLWTGIGQALAPLGPHGRGDDAPVPAVVVVTDGRIVLGDADRARVIARARAARARVFVVAVGGGGCDARLAGVAAALGGTCTEPGDTSPGGGLDGMAAAIWGASDDG
jgi:hypothetical protein